MASPEAEVSRVELAEEVEGEHSVQVHHDAGEQHRQNQLQQKIPEFKVNTYSGDDGTTHLFAVVRHRLQDGAERLEADGDVHEMHGEEERVEVAGHRHQEVPEDIQEGLCKCRVTSSNYAYIQYI